MALALPCTNQAEVFDLPSKAYHWHTTLEKICEGPVAWHTHQF